MLDQQSEANRASSSEDVDIDNEGKLLDAIRELKSQFGDEFSKLDEKIIEDKIGFKWKEKIVKSTELFDSVDEVSHDIFLLICRYASGDDVDLFVTLLSKDLVLCNDDRSLLNGSLEEIGKRVNSVSEEKRLVVSTKMVEVAKRLVEHQKNPTTLPIYSYLISEDIFNSFRNALLYSPTSANSLTQIIDGYNFDPNLSRQLTQIVQASRDIHPRYVSEFTYVEDISRLPDINRENLAETSDNEKNTMLPDKLIATTEQIREIVRKLNLSEKSQYMPVKRVNKIIGEVLGNTYDEESFNQVREKLDEKKHITERFVQGKGDFKFSIGVEISPSKIIPNTRLSPESFILSSLIARGTWKAFQDPNIENVTDRITNALSNGLEHIKLRESSSDRNSSTTSGIEIEIYSDKLPYIEKKDFEKIDSVQGLGVPVSYDSIREIELPPSIGSKDQLRVIYELYKSKTINPEFKINLHLNFGGADWNRPEALEVALLIRLIIDASGMMGMGGFKNLVDSIGRSALKSTANKHLYEGDAWADVGYPLVIRKNGVLELRDFGESINFQSLARDVLSINDLIECASGYIRIKSGESKNPSTDLKLSEIWEEIKSKHESITKEDGIDVIPFSARPSEISADEFSDLRSTYISHIGVEEPGIEADYRAMIVEIRSKVRQALLPSS